MRKIIYILFWMFVLPISLGFSTPPTSIALTYDVAKGSLHVQAIHPSFDLEKSYVRLMNVYVNGQEVSTLNYFKQNDPEEFIDDVPVTAQAGDVIKVELFCALGGDMSQEMTVGQTGAAQPAQGTGAVSDNSAADNTGY